MAPGVGTAEENERSGGASFRWIKVGGWKGKTCALRLRKRVVWKRIDEDTGPRGPAAKIILAIGEGPLDCRERGFEQHGFKSDRALGGDDSAD